MPITMLYHDVTPANADDSSGFAGPEAARYKLTPDEFSRHLDAVAIKVARPPLVTTSVEELQRAASDSWLIDNCDLTQKTPTATSGRLDRIMGGARLSDAYYQRVNALEDAVAAAQKQLDDVRR